MTTTAIPVSEAIDEAVDFVRCAWREAWAPMAITSLGWMLIVLGGHAAVGPQAANWSNKIGWALQLFNLPLLGALYRIGLGGRAYRGLGPGGLQLGGVEWRVLAVNIALSASFLLACFPMVCLSGLLFFLLHRLGGITLGPIGHWAWWFLFSAVFWAVLIGWLVYICARLGMATAWSVERRRIRPFSSWLLTEGQGRTIALAFILVKTPTVLVCLALWAFGWIEPSDVPIGLHGPWPLPDALGAGAIVGLILSVVQAPLSVGLLLFFYDVLAPIEAERLAEPDVQTEDVPASEDPIAEDPPVVPEEPEPPFSEVDYFPHIGRFSRIAGPWLAHEPLPEPYSYLAWPQDDAGDEDLHPVQHEVYPRSIVEYSSHTGRFSRLFAPWLAGEAAPLEQDGEALSVSAESVRPPEAEPPHPIALDGDGEAEHATP